MSTVQMNRLALVISLAAVTVCGCAERDIVGTSARNSAPQPEITMELRFQESEMRSRSWTNSAGARLELLDYSLVPFENELDLVIVKYGVRETGIVHCVDFYEKYPPPPSQEPWLLLIAHDYEPCTVVELKPVVERQRITISITRECVSAGDQTSLRKEYSYEYGKDHRMVRRMSEIITKP